ncbi:MAG: hypothetical protein DHS20C05_22800 [Hyphococcus sp.]|nr:MAG: hypothetical protein DHS20C05_22800 [Marinicaulis sp.]
MDGNKFTSVLVTALCLIGFGAIVGCTQEVEISKAPSVDYYDNTGRDDVLSGGVKMIPIETDYGTFNVWTKRTGNNPKIKLLLLHGGPAGTHEYFEAFDSFMPGAGIE